MSDEKYERRDEATQERDTLIQEMTGVRDHFVETFANELPERWDRIARHWIKSFPDETKRIGKSGLSDIKARISDMSKRTREIAEEHLTGGEIWPHEVGYGYRGSRFSTSQFDRIRRPMAEAENEVLVVLTDHFKGRFGRSLKGDLGDDLQHIAATYSEQDQRLRKLDEEINRLTHEIDTAEAETLWDDA